MDFNFDYEKLQNQQVITFLDKKDFDTIIDALNCRDDVSKEVFKQQYPIEEIQRLSEILMGKFSEFKGKVMFVSNALIATGTTSILLLPYVPDEQFKQIPQEQMEQLDQAYDLLSQFYNGIKEKFNK